MEYKQNYTPPTEEEKAKQYAGILKTIWALYNAPLQSQIPKEIDLSNALGFSLNEIANRIGKEISHMSLKATVLIIGNTSVGKSTLINWFLQDYIQNTGMAVETQLITVISSGQVPTYLSSDVLARMSENFKDFFQNFPKAKFFTVGKVISNNNSFFQNINLIDTPSLTDGKITKSIDYHQVIKYLASFADLIIVLFDPIGQATKSRSLRTIRHIHKLYKNKILYCLSKIDQIPTESERLKILSNTTQNLVSYVSFGPGLDVLPIYVPNSNKGQFDLTDLDYQDENLNNNKQQTHNNIANRIFEVKREIEYSVNKKIQTSFEHLRNDCHTLQYFANSLIEDLQLKNKQENRKSTNWLSLVILWGFLFELLSISFCITNYHFFFVEFSFIIRLLRHIKLDHIFFNNSTGLGLLISLGVFVLDFIIAYKILKNLLLRGRFNNKKEKMHQLAIKYIQNDLLIINSALSQCEELENTFFYDKRGSVEEQL